MALSLITPDSLNLAQDYAGMGFGGTGSANQLDDYEEGTWTVNLYKGGSALAVTSRYAHYTKIGDLLFIAFYWFNSSITTTGGSTWQVGGLPFNLAAAGNGSYQSIPVGYYTRGGTDQFLSESHRWQANASTTLTMYGNSKADNVSSNQLEFSGSGVFRTA